MSDLVGNPEDRFSHNEAHFMMYQKMSHSFSRRECKFLLVGGSPQPDSAQAVDGMRHVGFGLLLVL